LGDHIALTTSHLGGPIIAAGMQVGDVDFLRRQLAVSRQLQRDVVTVQRALGHSSATTTLNTYSHLWPTAEDRTRAAAGELWTAALADSLRTSEIH